VSEGVLFFYFAWGGGFFFCFPSLTPRRSNLRSYSKQGKRPQILYSYFYRDSKFQEERRGWREGGGRSWRERGLRGREKRRGEMKERGGKGEGGGREEGGDKI
jgi:hypothetical protein